MVRKLVGFSSMVMVGVASQVQTNPCSPPRNGCAPASMMAQSIVAMLVAGGNVQRAQLRGADASMLSECVPVQ